MKIGQRIRVVRDFIGDNELLGYEGFITHLHSTGGLSATLYSVDPDQDPEDLTYLYFDSEEVEVI